MRQVLLALTLIIVAAKIGGEFLGRIGQPPVLGELLMGVVLGNLGLFGITALQPLRDSALLQVVAEIGAILLLFEVGVESDLLQLLSVGWSSLLVATLGVIAPMILGYAVSLKLLPDANWLTHLFIGGTLTATSVGITARVLKDLGRSKTTETRIILGAAVADDVIALLVLALISGLASATASNSAGGLTIRWPSILWIVAKTVSFLAAAVLAGRFLSPRVFLHAAKLQVQGVLLGLCVCFCFLVSALAGMVGLAPIVGAFAAGIVLEEIHYRPFRERGERKVEELLFPITTLIVPVFFVTMGLRVDLKSFTSPPVLAFAAVISLVAIAGKLICGLGVLEPGADRLAIAIGMIPRGEVGLIFSAMGATLMFAGRPILSPTTFSALVVMIIITTFITPPLLKWVFSRARHRF